MGNVQFAYLFAKYINTWVCESLFGNWGQCIQLSQQQMVFLESTHTRALNQLKETHDLFRKHNCDSP